MQFINHKLTSLTIAQKYFIEKSIELLYRGTIDSYRVRVKNPKSILAELKQSIEAFENGQLKNFIAIANKDSNQPALKDEAIYLCDSERNYLKFNSFSKEYFITTLNKLSESNYKQVKNCIAILLRENNSYTEEVLQGLKTLLFDTAITPDIQAFKVLEKINKTVNYLYTDLIDSGFSKSFLYRHIYGLFVNNLNEDDNFEEKFKEFENRIKVTNNNYTIVFKIDTTNKVRANIRSTSATMEVVDNIDALSNITSAELNNFKTPKTNRLFIKCTIIAADYLSALKAAKVSLAENLDVLNLGYSDQDIYVHNRVLVIDNNNPSQADFQNTTNFLDGKYKVTREHYLHFTERVPVILANPKVKTESKEKIKSAIRYLRLGNQSTEVEHKFINYWIGLEYLFSSHDSYNTISRIKEYFVACHSLVYVKRNLYNFHSEVSKLDLIILSTLKHYNAEPIECLTKLDFYTEVKGLLPQFPLLAERANFFSKLIEPIANKEMSMYVKLHQKNLIIHFTRIYRLRNEIIHDAATNTNNENVAANLRYYLTFALNGAIDYLRLTHEEIVGIEDYFTLSEIHLGNIEQGKWQLTDLLNVPSSIDFIL